MFFCVRDTVATRWTVLSLEQGLLI